MVKLIGEIGINHNGSIKQAKKIIDKFSFLDVFKFQKLDPKTSLTDKKYNSPHPVPENSFGSTYGEHKEYLEFSILELLHLKEYIHKKGKEFAISVFDIKAANEVINLLSPDYIKIPSCRCNDFELMNYVFNNYKGLIHISTGMTTATERKKLENFLKNKKSYYIYSCTSDYSGNGPIFIENLDGFSCHIPDIIYAQLASIYKLSFIEYHITLDQEEKGTDHKISLLPKEFKELKKWIYKNHNKLKKVEISKPDSLPKVESLAKKKLWKHSK